MASISALEKTRKATEGRAPKLFLFTHQAELEKSDPLHLKWFKSAGSPTTLSDPDG